MGTNPTLEGDGTALYISNRLADLTWDPIVARGDHAVSAGYYHRQRARICK